jgi:prepilin peptidase CpaA
VTLVVADLLAVIHRVREAEQVVEPLALPFGIGIRESETPANVAVGLVINGALAGASGLLASAAGLLTAMLILFPPFALGGIGGGDVKMMGAVGAFVGPRMVLAAMACGMILGGVVMVGVLARRGILSDKLMGTFVMLRSAVVTRSIAPLRAPAAAPGAIALPYSVPLALGTVAALGYSRAFGG